MRQAINSRQVIPCSDQRGFSLIEMLTASLLLATVLLAVGMIYPRGMSAITASSDRARASSLAQKKLEELFEAGHREGVPIVPIYDIESFVHSPHTKSRELFKEMDHPVVGKFDYPGPPYKWTETPAQIRRPAPSIGEHNEKIYCQELGYSKADLSALRLAGII